MSSKYSEELKKWLVDNYKGSRQEVCDNIYNVFGIKITVSQLHGLVRRARKKYDIPYTMLTRFQKNNIPKNKINCSAIGSEFKHSDGYTYIKTDYDKWVRKEKVVYEKTYGKLPKGYMVISKDKNKNNFNPNNLFAINRKDGIYLIHNNLIFEDKDLLDTSLMILNIKRKVRKYELI